MQTIDLVKCVNVFLEKNVFKFSFFSVFYTTRIIENQNFS